MSEIKIGEYVRTDNGISKVIENVDKYVTDKQISVDFIGGMYAQVIDKKIVLNHSKNIIDLMEKDDMLKIDAGFRNYIFYITRVTEQEIIDGISIISKKHIDNNFIISGGAFRGCKFTIVTKEQFKNIEYKVGE